MAFDTEVFRKHWKPITGIVVGLLVLFFLLRSRSSSTNTSLAGTANQVQSLSAAASLQNAQINGQVEIAGYSASVANNQTAAALQASLADTAAKLQATNTQTASSTAVALAADNSAVEIQRILSTQAVDQTKIQGATLTNIAGIQGNTQVTIAQGQYAVEQAQLKDVNAQINSIFKGSKHFSTDIRAFAPVIALETGQGTAAASLGQSNASAVAATSPAATIGSATKGIASIASALFG